MFDGNIFNLVRFIILCEFIDQIFAFMNLPKDLKYTEEHEWIKVDGNIALVGITDFAQSELGDIVYIDSDCVGENVDLNEVFGTIEAVKTVSDLFMPVSGEILEFSSLVDMYGLGYLDCDGNCLYDCDNDGACDWSQNHCYDTDGNLISTTDQINNVTFEIGPDGLLDCLSFIYVDSIDNCVYNSGVDLVNNLTLELISDGVPDCLEGFDYTTYSNPFQTDVDGDGICGDSVTEGQPWH